MSIECLAYLRGVTGDVRYGRYATTSSSVQKRTASDLALEHSVSMKRKELRPKELFHVPCPTCGATAGGPCELHSGAPRSRPHVERKFAAIEATGRK